MCYEELLNVQNKIDLNKIFTSYQQIFFLYFIVTEYQILN